MVFPSFYEGFGLPILEAMACGRAVACSNTSSMPEVANAAAILFDPNSTDDIARAMRDVLVDPELRTPNGTARPAAGVSVYMGANGAADTGDLSRSCGHGKRVVDNRAREFQRFVHEDSSLYS